jgi:hypothetical protein
MGKLYVIGLPASNEAKLILLSVSDPRQISLRRIASSGMLRCVALVRTEVSEELSVSFITVTRIGDEGDAKFLRNVCSYKCHAA